MSADRDEFAARKALLLAQSALYRAQLKYRAATLRGQVARGSSWVARGFALFSIVRRVLSMAGLLRR
jgi:hypothetical protein